MGIFFSVLVPAYKSRYLHECIDSILAQTYKNFEIVIVNDASPENIDDIVSKYQDKRIRYYKNSQNIGALNVIDNWNKCLNYSEGDYVICMGDDDRLLPCCLNEYNNLLNKYPGIGVLHGWTEIINEQSEVVALTTHRCEYESAMSLLWHRIHSYSNQYIGDFCYNTQLLRKNNGFYYLPMAWGSDDISAIIAASEKGIANTQRVVFQYRSSAYTISSRGNYISKLDAILEEEKWYNNFLIQPCCDHYDNLYRIQLLNEIEKIEEKKKIVLISYDIKTQSLLRLLFWVKKRNHYSLKWRTLCFALIRSIVR